VARLTINGQPLEIRMDPDTPLLWGLRDGAGLTGTKYGCGNGDCGACTVIVDGQAMRSCTLTLGESEGRVVTTIEGISQVGAAKTGLHPAQQALLDEQAIQCGFCTPGIVMAAAALLQSNAEPSEADIGAALTNLCRCGVYPRLVRAVQRAGAAMRGAVTPTDAPAPAPAISPDGVITPASPQPAH
jgi:isoquinoline 1-oxidoreductase alpha subunit